MAADQTEAEVASSRESLLGDNLVNRWDPIFRSALRRLEKSTPYGENLSRLTSGGIFTLITRADRCQITS